MLHMASDWFALHVTKGCGKLGCAIGRNPYCFLLLPIITTAFLAPGLVMLNDIISTLYLYTPTNGRFITERSIVEELFPMNLSTNFDPGRVTREIQCGYVILVAKDGGSMLREKTFKDVLKVDRVVKNVTVHHQGLPMSYSQLCARRNRRCYVNNVLSLSKRIKQIEEGKYKFIYPLTINLATYRFTYYAVNLGGVETDSKGNVLSAKSIRLLYYLSDKEKKANELWEVAFLRRLEQEIFEEIIVYRYTSQTVDTELQEISQQGRLWMGLALIIMSICSFVFCFLSKRPGLGLSCIVSSCLTIVSAFGLLGYCGVDFIATNFMLSFIVLALTIDDSYQLIFRIRDPRKTIEEHMGETYATTLPSILISTIIDVLFYTVSLCFVHFPALKIFCLYSSICIVFTFTYSVTFSGAVLVLSDRAEVKGFHYLTCCKTKGKWHSNRLTKSKHTSNFSIFTANIPEVQSSSKECSTNNSTKTVKKDMNNSTNFTSTLLIIFHSQLFKLTIIIVTLGYIAISAWSISTNIKIGAELTNFVSYDSYGGQFVKQNNFYYSRYPYRVQMVINATLDYSNSSVRSQVENIIHRMEKCRYIGDNVLTESWLKYYMTFLNDNRTSSLIQGLNIKTKKDFNIGLKDVFLRLPITEIFHDDVKFSKDGSDIVAARFVLQAADVTLSEGEKEMTRELRQIADNSPYPVVIYSYGFPHTERLLTLANTSLNLLGVCLTVYFLMTFMLSGRMLFSLASTSCLMFVINGSVAYLSLWSVNLNSATVINLLFVICLVIRYSVYITCTYCTISDEEHSSFVNRLSNTTVPILKSAIPVMLSAAIVGLGPSMIFTSFFKMTFVLITSSLFFFCF
ncbi:patched domain-containing protein 3-like isoform X1 [Centruroides vittatus]|uniref:patched domain-containing protein 3-like isoform X1 n=1 Tax=Centruroides vittatus TaxID=120091 RepID=UPI00350F9B48